MAEKIYKDPIAEARRYSANARRILNENTENDGLLISDPKFVKMAGHTLWCGCLIALQAALQNLLPECKTKATKGKNIRRLDINDIKEAAAKRDRKLTVLVANAYEVIHLNMGYDGIQLVGAVNGAFQLAERIIDWCERNMPKKIIE